MLVNKLKVATDCLSTVSRLSCYSSHGKANFTLAEVDDLIQVFAPLQTHKFRAGDILRYPKSHCIWQIQIANTSILTYLKKRKTDWQQTIGGNGSFLSVPNAYTTIRTNLQKEKFY